MKRKAKENAIPHPPVGKASGRKDAGDALPHSHFGAALSSAMPQFPKKAGTNVIDMQPYRDERELLEQSRKLMKILFEK